MSPSKVALRQVGVVLKGTQTIRGITSLEELTLWVMSRLAHPNRLGKGNSRKALVKGALETFSGDDALRLDTEGACAFVDPAKLAYPSLPSATRPNRRSPGGPKFAHH